MIKLYKLTDVKGQTHGGCQWGEGVTHTAPGNGVLCTEAWIHAYTDPLLAVLLNPIHGKFDLETMRLWECEGDVGINDHGFKVGCTLLTTICEIPVPQVTLEQQVRFGILCAKEVYTEPGWNAWADAWLDGSECSRAKAAEAAAKAAEAAAEAARAAAQEAKATEAAAWAAWAAAQEAKATEANAAEAKAWAVAQEARVAWAKAARMVAWAKAAAWGPEAAAQQARAAAAKAEAEAEAEEAAWAKVRAAWAATDAVACAARAAKVQDKSIDLIALAHEAVEW